MELEGREAGKRRENGKEKKKGRGKGRSSPAKTSYPTPVEGNSGADFTDHTATSSASNRAD